MASLPSSVSTAAHSLVSSATMLRVHLILPSMSLTSHHCSLIKKKGRGRILWLGVRVPSERRAERWILWIHFKTWENPWRTDDEPIKGELENWDLWENRTIRAERGQDFKKEMKENLCSTWIKESAQNLAFILCTFLFFVVVVKKMIFQEVITLILCHISPCWKRRSCQVKQ